MSLSIFHKKAFRPLLLVGLIVLSVLSLSSCQKIKEMITGNTSVEKPEGYIETRENELFKYDVFKNHITITGYLGTDVEVTVPAELDGKPVTTIGEIAFFSNPIAEKINLPATLTTIERNAFYYSINLKELVIPNSVKTIGDRAFSWCSALEKVTLPSGLTQITDYMFNNNTALKEIVIPAGVKQIGKRAFSFCSSLERVVLPDGIEEVGERAFTNCLGLTYITVPGSVSTFGAAIFEDSAQVTVVTPEGTPFHAYLVENEYKTTVDAPPPEVSEPEVSQ